MNNKVLKDTIQQLFAGSKGLLAMDEINLLFYSPKYRMLTPTVCNTLERLMSFWALY